MSFIYQSEECIFIVRWEMALVPPSGARKLGVVSVNIQLLPQLTAPMVMWYGCGGERRGEGGREMSIAVQWNMAHLCTTFTNICYTSPSSFFLFMEDGTLV